MGAQGKDATEPEPESLTIGQKVKANLVAGKDAAAKGFGAAAASVGSAANSCYDKASTLPGAVKPTAQAAWGWTKQGAADSFDATRIFLSEFTTAEMAVCEAKFRAARRRQEADKKDFGERILESLAAECGDALTSAKGAKVVGCLREGSESLQLYMESQAKFKEHEEAMAAARKEYEELKSKAKATWKVDVVSAKIDVASGWVNKQSDSAIEYLRSTSSPKNVVDGAATPDDGASSPKRKSWFAPSTAEAPATTAATGA